MNMEPNKEMEMDASKDEADARERDERDEEEDEDEGEPKGFGRDEDSSPRRCHSQWMKDRLNLTRNAGLQYNRGRGRVG